jgi:hypothetical protein
MSMGPTPPPPKVLQLPGNLLDTEDEEMEDEPIKKKGKQAGKTQPPLSQGPSMDHTKYIAGLPGHIPNSLGIILINGKYEQDNKMWMMTSGAIFHSVCFNCIFIWKPAAVTPTTREGWMPPFPSQMIDVYIPTCRGAFL